MGPLRWVAALVRRRPLRLAGAAAGVAMAVALLASIGAFLTAARGDMTRRAADQVAVDWQVEVQPGADPQTVLAALQHRAHVQQAVPVGMATSDGFESTIGATTQTTGPGVIVGLPPDYRALFPGAVRTLAGAGDGVLLAQQTAANLHAGPGDTVLVRRSGLPPVAMPVDAVVDLPAADSLFQKVGAPPGAQPQAAPDNVMLVPLSRWHGVFDDLGVTRPDLVRTQVHARLDRALPSDPAAAFSRVTAMAHRVEADLAGAALVGNNLGATLDAARSDALYAEVLFVLLGLPGAALAALLTRAVAAAGRDRRRREFALLRARGASVAYLRRLAMAEALTVGGAGAATGLGLGALVSRLAFGSATLGTTGLAAAGWALASATAGVVLALLTIAVPAHRDARDASVVASRRVVGLVSSPAVLRYGVDVVLLAGAAVVFWATGRSHYALVLAPEGVPTVSVSYWALAGPVLLWAGAGLLAWRLSEAVLGRGPLLRRILRPVTGGLATPVAATLRRQRRALSAAIVLIALTVAFAVSTAVFNATYRQQVEIDALLTNGAPVTVTAPPGRAIDAAQMRRITSTPGVSRVEPVQHRFVYVGADLQDLYGVRPGTIGVAGKLQDSYVAGGSVDALLREMGRRPDAVLVSAETVQDFQLRPGDQLRLRVRDPKTGTAVEVPFHFAGVIKEFPTAPSDSFVVANASYVAARTGAAAPELLLVTPSGASPSTIATRVRSVVGPAATVTDIEHSRRIVGSSLTAVDLSGLTRLELGYTVVLALGAAGLVFGLGLAERRRSLAITTAIGARPRQVATFAGAEAAALAVLGGGLGALAGWALAAVIVKVLTGVFDPPPAHMAVPWTYLLALAVAVGAGLIAASQLAVRSVRPPVVGLLRDAS